MKRLSLSSFIEIIYIIKYREAEGMERLRALRDEAGMTQVRLATELGVSQETISGYEIGKAVPPADMLVKLADRLNTSVDYILGRTDNKHPTRLLENELTELESDLIAHFRKLSSQMQQRALGYVIGLYE